MTNINSTDRKLAAATGLYLEGIRDGQPESALSKYTGHRYTQHSTGVGDGKEGFMAFFTPFLEHNTSRDIRVVRAIVDGSYVFCHVFQSLNQGESQWVTMDMFDTDNNDRIIEHWDVIAAYQEQSISGADMVAGETSITDIASTDENKALVKEFTKQVLVQREHDKVPNFVSADCIQHNPQVVAGAVGLQSALNSGVMGEYEMLFKVIGQGNFAVSYSKVFQSSTDSAVFDVYRLAEGKIVEHWSLAEQILPREQWGNSGKF